MSTLSLSAVVSFGWKSSIASTADHFFNLVFSGQVSEGSFDLDGSHTTTSETKNQVESGFFLDVVVRQCSSIFQLLASEDESLLIRRDTFLVLDLSPKREEKR